MKQGINHGVGEGVTAKGKTYIVFSDPERTVDVIVRSPNSRNTGIVVTELLLKVRSELTDDSGICGMFVDLRTECLPRSAA